MKKLKVALISFAVGLVLSIPAIAVLAECTPNCSQTIVYEGKVCTLMGAGCNADCSVCSCAYNCGPA